MTQITVAHPVVAQPVPDQTQPFGTSSPWSYKLCGCFEDMGICCDVFWCGCCVLGSTCEAIYHHKARTQNYLVAVAALLGTAASWVVFGLPCVQFPFCCFVMSQRMKLRRTYGISGHFCNDAFDDCCCAFWCGGCVLCQMYKEVSKRGTPPSHCCCRPKKTYATATIAIVQPAYPTQQVADDVCCAQPEQGAPEQPQYVYAATPQQQV